MALARTVVSEGLLDELDRFEELVRPLSAGAVGHAQPVRRLDRRRRRPPRRSARWPTSRPAASTVSARPRSPSARSTSAPVARPPSWPTNAPRSRRPRPGCCRCSTTRRGPRAGPGGFDGTLGDGVEALWYDTWMHARRHPRRARHDAGHELRLPGRAISHVAWDLARSPTGTARCPTADDAAYTFILVATGRADASSLGADAPPNIYA